MAVVARVKRTVFLFHRWTGIGMCILMALWFVSGIVMLFVGYPKLTPWERLGGLPPLARAGCCAGPEDALLHSKARDDVRRIVLTSIGARPQYVLHEGDGSYTVVDAISGALVPGAGERQALESARGFLPGAVARYAGAVHEDRWTHGRALNAHRPLHVVDMQDAASTRLYVSSRTGEVLLDAPLAQRAWNFAGAWLHWLYIFRSQSADPVWSWTVIILSAVGVVSAVTGICNGIWRWRFAGTYKNGSRTPFRENHLRWHHMLGLGFGAVVLAWIFSGLMSMNPFGMFSAHGARPDMAAFQGGHPGSSHLPLPVPAALALLAQDGYVATELEWLLMDGKPYLLATDGGGNTRLITRTAAGYAVRANWTQQELMAAAQRLLPAPVRSHQLLEQHDAYYYRREAEAMNGAHERRLPVLRIMYDDPTRTWVYIDVSTGQIALSVDRTQRVSRWLFNFLHSWDLPVLLGQGWLREAVLVLLSIGGLLLSATAVVLGWRRLRKAVPPRPGFPAAAARR